MKPKTKFLKLALYNAGSLNTGQDDFLVAVDRFGPDIIAINESWLPIGQEACAPAPLGYRLRITARPQHVLGGRGGGVAFYVKKDMRVRFLKHLVGIGDVEQMWLSTQSNGYRLIVGTAYKPPWMNIDTFIDALTESIASFSGYDYLVLLGDFNVNMLEISDSKTEKINNFLEYLDLRQVVKDPTHYTNHSQTLLDIVCTNCNTRNVTVTNITGSLGHSMINFSLMLEKPKLLPRFIQFRSFKSIDLRKFNEDLLRLDWESVCELSSVEHMVNEFNSLLLALMDKHAPLIFKKIKQGHSLPWITDMIKFMMGLRNEAYNKYRNSKSEVHYEYYKDLKKLVKTSINNEKRAYYNHYINTNTDDSKVFWKNIKEKILVDPSKTECLPDCFNDPNKINNHFLTLHGPETVPISHLSYYEHHRFDYNCTNFELSPVSENDIAKYIKSISSSAIGNDGICRDMVLLTLPRTLSVITEMVNKSIATGIVPIQWKMALVTPLPKVNDPSDLKDLRPISILPFLSKILEKAIYHQVIRYVECVGILPPYQSGFRKGRGTVTALLDVTDNILADQDKGRGTIMALLDFSRAFDSINSKLLLSKLAYYGFGRHAVSWFDSYLSDRCQTVKLRKEDGSYAISSPKTVKKGVPQGSILGPLLFVIYSADLPNVIRNCRYHCYADDIQLYISVSPADTAVALKALGEDLDAIATWSIKNCIKLNPTKTKLMILGTKNQYEKIWNKSPVIKIFGEDIEIVNEAKNLGIVFDSKLRFETHVLNLVRNCFYRLKIMYRIRNYLTEKARITLCESIILSRLNYGDLVYGPRLLYKTKRMLQRVQNACCRFCFNVPPRSHITPFLNKASMLNLEARRRLHLAAVMYDVIHLKNPEYLYNKLNFSTFHKHYGPGIPRATRAPLVVEIHKTVNFTGSFRYQATKCWNNIPPPIRTASSRYTFKKKLKILLLEKQKTNALWLLR